MSNAKNFNHGFLSANAFGTYNKAVARIIGIDAALLLADLISKEKYFIEKGNLQNNGEFFNCRDNIEWDTTLSDYQQRRAEKILIDNNLIYVNRKGIPAKNYYYIRHDNVKDFADKCCEQLITRSQKTKPKKLKNFTSSGEKNKEQYVKKLHSNNNNNDNNNNNNINKENRKNAKTSINKNDPLLKKYIESTYEKLKGIYKNLPPQVPQNYFEVLAKALKNPDIGEDKIITAAENCVKSEEKYKQNSEWLFKNFNGEWYQRIFAMSKAANNEEDLIEAWENYQNQNGDEFIKQWQEALKRQ